MKYFTGCIILFLVCTGCSSTETVQTAETTEQTVPVSPQPSAPSWYTPGTHSSSDSLEVHGYSLASAADSSRAVEFSSQTALKYLRFEIDKMADNIRKNLVSSLGGSEIYDSPSFMIRLRKTISNLPLHSAAFTWEHNSPDGGIHYSYSRATISRSEIYNLLESRLEDDRFLREVEN